MTEVYGHEVEEVIGSAEALRAYARRPSDRVKAKETDHIDPLAQRFIAASPLVFVASRREDGTLDVTPRGDPAGFVHVLDEHTLAMPDRPGNFRMDTFENVIRDGFIGLIFVIPGHGDTLRVSGEATLVRDRGIGEKLAVNGRPSEFAILIRVQHVLSHCPKAFVRAGVWTQERWPDTSGVPTLAELIVAHGNLTEGVEEMAEIIDRDRETRLY